MKKFLIFLAVLVLAGGGIYFYQKSSKQAKAPADGNSTSTQNSGLDQQQNNGSGNQNNSQAENPATSTPAPAAKQPQTAKPSEGTFSSGEEGMNPDVQVWQTVYDGSSFDPAVLDIKVGDVVIFKNSGSGAFWPASDPHPAHTGYPGFDAGKAVASGSKYQFQFTKSGSFGFHDHLNPAAKGTINVTK